MAPLRGDVGGAFMRPWFIARAVSTAINDVIQLRADVDQGAMNGAPTGVT